MAASNIDYIRPVTEKLSTAKALKAEGNEFYKKGETKKALSRYHKALLYLRGIKCDIYDKERFNFGINTSKGDADKVSAAVEKDVLDTEGQVYNNLAAALLALPESDPEKIVSYAESAIERFPKNEKAWHRKGVALFKLKKFDEAEEALKASLSFSATGIPDPKTKDMLARISEATVQHKQKQKDMYKKMLSA